MKVRVCTVGLFIMFPPNTYILCSVILRRVAALKISGERLHFLTFGASRTRPDSAPPRRGLFPFQQREECYGYHTNDNAVYRNNDPTQFPSNLCPTHVGVAIKGLEKSRWPRKAVA